MSLHQGRLFGGVLLCSWLQLGPSHALLQGCPCAPDYAAFAVWVMGRGDSQEQTVGSGFSGARVSCRTSPDPRHTTKALLFPCNADINTPPYMKSPSFDFICLQVPGYLFTSTFLTLTCAGYHCLPLSDCFLSSPGFESIRRATLVKPKGMLASLRARLPSPTQARILAVKYEESELASSIQKGNHMSKTLGF